MDGGELGTVYAGGDLPHNTKANRRLLDDPDLERLAAWLRAAV